jgi:hypothetical protein
MATAEKVVIAGFHFAFPSVGHVEKDGAGYQLVPIAWSAVPQCDLRMRRLESRHVLAAFPFVSSVLGRAYVLFGT